MTIKIIGKLFSKSTDYFFISKIIFYNKDIGNNPKNFREFATKYQEKNGCFLCGKKHKIEFLCFVKRSYRKEPSDDSDEIFEIEYIDALRFLCRCFTREKKKN